jgi:hypothetical protein
MESLGEGSVSVVSESSGGVDARTHVSNGHSAEPEDTISPRPEGLPTSDELDEAMVSAMRKLYGDEGASRILGYKVP